MIDSLDLACGGAAQLVRLVGEAGIGKSRLVNEFVARARDEDRFAGVAIRRAVCSPLGEQSYGTLAAVLRSAYGIAQKATAAEAQAKLATALSELGLAVEEAERLMPLYFHVLGLGDPDAAPAARRARAAAAADLLCDPHRHSNGAWSLSPLLIIVEDLHWADAVSLEALRFVMDRLERTRLMLLLTHRPMLELDPARSGRMSHTTLRCFRLVTQTDKSCWRRYFSHGWSGSSGNLFNRILERAGGNPLFIEEIVRGLIEVGALKRDGQQWRIKSDEAATDIPAGIQAMLLARVDRCRRRCAGLAQEAAVIGPRFDAGLLGAIGSRSGRRWKRDSNCCAMPRSSRRSPGANSISPQSYRFTQTMLQDVIYQNLLLQRRIEMHGRIGAALERHMREQPERLEDLILLGHHFSLSASKPKARVISGRPAIGLA